MRQGAAELSSDSHTCSDFGNEDLANKRELFYEQMAIMLRKEVTVNNDKTSYRMLELDKIKKEVLYPDSQSARLRQGESLTDYAKAKMIESSNKIGSPSVFRGTSFNPSLKNRMIPTSSSNFIAYGPEIQQRN